MNKTQTLIADLMKQSDFNNFRGKEIVATLLEYKDLWKSFIWGRFDHSPLITLRDISSDSYNADTLYVLCEPEHEELLYETLKQKTNADEVDVEDIQKTNALLGSFPANMSLIRLWWD